MQYNDKNKCLTHLRRKFLNYNISYFNKIDN